MRRIFFAYNYDRDQEFVSRLMQLLGKSAHFQAVDSAVPNLTHDQGSQVASQIQRASMFIAMFKGASANVMLETGIALGAGKQILIVGGEPESLPGELRALPYIALSGDTDLDLAAVMARLNSFQIEEEHPRSIYRTVPEQLRTYLDDPPYFESISAAEFEELIFQWFQELGFMPSRPHESRDFGIDFLAQSPIDQSTIVVEAKKHSRQGRVSMRDVMALLGAASLFKANTAVLITSSSFTRAALEMVAESRDPRLRLLTMEEILQSRNLVGLTL
jgi:hypothetical protein